MRTGIFVWKFFDARFVCTMKASMVCAVYLYLRKSKLTEKVSGSKSMDWLDMTRECGDG